MRIATVDWQTFNLPLVPEIHEKSVEYILIQERLIWLIKLKIDERIPIPSVILNSDTENYFGVAEAAA